jgi:hypothetical protein
VEASLLLADMAGYDDDVQLQVGKGQLGKKKGG